MADAADAGAANDEPAGAVVIENAEMRLVIAATGVPQSLVHKATGQECLRHDDTVSMFTLTQDMPYDNEVQAIYPGKIKHFPADRVSRDNDRLIVHFALVGFEAIIKLKVTDSYVGFRLEQLKYTGYTSLRPKMETPVDETVFVQLPVRKRQNFGEWLNVVWDQEVAVNLLATDQYTRIDAEPRSDYHLLHAGTEAEVQLTGAGAALIVTSTPRLLDRIAQIEEDFGLSHGVASRRSKEYKYSYYEATDANTSNIDEHIKFAQMGGFRTMQINYRAFSDNAGHFPWRPDYPNGMKDLKAIVDKISAAGIIPGIHIYPSKVGEQDSYVTPTPDPRLDIRERFTLLNAIDSSATVIPIAENPDGHLTVGSTGGSLVAERKILRVQEELISFERYTNTPPYQFEDCKRGVWGTRAEAHEPGSQVGLLDVDDAPAVIVTQNTTLEGEIAERLTAIYEQAGFKFVYYDGAEDVPKPYWYTVSRSQWIVQQQLKPEPLFAEGAVRGHFGWHFLSRGNAFDVIRPEVMKAGTRAYAAAEAPLIAQDFSSTNFGWIGYWPPSDETIGDQPDMLEYVTSRAAGWDCPVSLDGLLKPLAAHPRTPDNLEVLKRWEDVRAANWLSQAQKEQLKNLDQEHTLLLNEQNAFELVPYAEIERIAGSDRPARGFVFERNDKVYVVYWHVSGSATLEVKLPAHQVKLLRDIGKPMTFKRGPNGIQLPLERRLYLECTGLPPASVVSAFQSASIRR